MVKKKTNKKISRKNSVTETFEIVDKKGKEREIKVPVKEIIHPSTKLEIKEYNKILIWTLSIIGGLILLFLLGYGILHINSHSSYADIVKFEKIKQGDITFYHTSFERKDSVTNKMGEYNVYLRTSPRILEQIPFEGKLNLTGVFVYNFDNPENTFQCEGKGVIAIANMNQIFNAVKITTLYDPNATCDEQNRYNFIKLISSNENKIVQTNATCYEFYIKDCDILPVTEKYLAELLVEINKIKSKS